MFSPNDNEAAPSDDAASETSTLEYDQEPFESYQGRVRSLLRDLYDSEVADGADIERMAGGSYNRTIGVTLSTQPNESLVLRIPRFEDCDDIDVAQFVAVLRALAPTLPVPEVVHFDAGASNTLGRPFILMRRLQGHTLETVLHSLTVPERCSIATDIARCLHAMLTVPVLPGYGPLFVSGDGALCAADTPPLRTVPDFIRLGLEELRTSALATSPPDMINIAHCDRLDVAATVLLDGLTFSGRSTLFHTDFAARNIVVDKATEDGVWRVTGVLDWDEAEVAPYEIACVCPVWLWSHQSEPHTNVHENYLDPDAPVFDDDCARIRSAFVDAIERLEPGFMRVVRTTRDRCLRTLYERARAGFHCDEHLAAVSNVEAMAREHVLARELAAPRMPLGRL